MKRILTIALFIFMIAIPAFAADYATSQKIDGMADVSGAITGSALVPVQDMNDTDKI